MPSNCTVHKPRSRHLINTPSFAYLKWTKVMGFWANICAFALVLFQEGPASLYYPQALKGPLYFFLEQSKHTGGVGHYEPEIVNLTPPQQCPHNQYDSQFDTANVCNTPGRRDQWCDGTTIITDYEDTSQVPVTGKTNKYTLVLTSNNNTFCGDGYCRDTTLINGTYPGPLIRGNWGDMFEITVINKLSNCNGSTIHWHGIRQWRSVWEDGVPGVTECPIPPNKSRTYRWHATQYGTTWYHSHFSLQYANGIAGPLIIDGPTSMDYTEDKGPLLLTDWYHADAFGLYFNEVKSDPGSALTPASVLVNGRGNFTQVNYTSGSAETVFGCSPKNDTQCRPECASVAETNIHPSKNGEPTVYYKYRIINTSIQTHFTFWIDDHDIWVVATDFVPIQPIRRKFINIAIGQRYDILVPAKSRSDLMQRGHPDYWILMRRCDKLCVGDPCPPNTDCTGRYVECRQGILHYENSGINLPPHVGVPYTPDPEVPTTNCTDIERKTLKPMVARNLTNVLPPTMKFNDPFEVDRRPGTQDFTSVFSRPWGGHSTRTASTTTTTATVAAIATVRDELKLRGGSSDRRPIPPPNFNEPGEEDEPHLWDFGSSLRSAQHPNGSYISFMIDWANATLGLAASNIPPTQWNPRFVPMVINGNDTTYTIFVIASRWNSTENHGTDLHIAVPGAAHPIHIHGHDFVLLRQSQEIFDYKKEYPLDLNNPARRDVVMLPANGFIIVAFKVDNPGTWLMHCHIAWHASAGLALQWVERPAEIPGMMGDTSPQRKEFDRTCGEWMDHENTKCSWEAGQPAIQDDSGI